jgi:hypothetical protein
MSYATIDALTQDAIFAGRVRACTTEQAERFQNDERPALVALARDVAIGAPLPALTFIRITAAAPGIADQAQGGDPLGDPDGPDQSRVPDAAILAVVQNAWMAVAGIYFDDDGNRKELGI